MFLISGSILLVHNTSCEAHEHDLFSPVPVCFDFYAVSCNRETRPRRTEFLTVHAGNVGLGIQTIPGDLGSHRWRCSRPFFSWTVEYAMPFVFLSMVKSSPLRSELMGTGAVIPGVGFEPSTDPIFHRSRLENLRSYI